MYGSIGDGRDKMQQVTKKRLTVLESCEYNTYNMNDTVVGTCHIDQYRAPGSAIWARLNIKTVFPMYRDSYVKDKTVGETVLSLTWEPLYW